MYDKLARQKYTNIQVSTVDRGRLLLMLYDGCVNFLKHAEDGLANKDIVKFSRFLSKAQAIIAELMNTLDFEKGGVIAKDLDRLYDFMLFHLTEANLEKNQSKVRDVIKLLETIANAYREVIEGGKVDAELGKASSENAGADTGATQASSDTDDKQSEERSGGLRVSF